MTTKCARMGMKISCLIDRELKSNRELRFVRSHVETCPRCAATYRELRSARLSSRTLRQQDPPSDFWSDICRRIDAVGNPETPAEELPRRRTVQSRGLQVRLGLLLIIALLTAAGTGALIVYADHLPTADPSLGVAAIFLTRRHLSGRTAASQRTATHPVPLPPASGQITFPIQAPRLLRWFAPQHGTSTGDAEAGAAQGSVNRSGARDRSESDRTTGQSDRGNAPTSGEVRMNGDAAARE